MQSFGVALVRNEVPDSSPGSPEATMEKTFLFLRAAGLGVASGQGKCELDQVGQL